MSYELFECAGHWVHLHGLDSNQRHSLRGNIGLLLGGIFGVFYIRLGICMAERYQFRFLAEFQNDAHENGTQQFESHESVASMVSCTKC